MTPENKAKAFRILAIPLIKQGPLHVSFCCNKQFIGLKPAKTCGTCGKEAIVHIVSNDEELDALADMLSK